MNIKTAVLNLWGDPEYKENRSKQISEKSFSHKRKLWGRARRTSQMKKHQKQEVTT